MAMVSRWTRKFQSTLPVWGATFDFDVHAMIFSISIHAPRVGSDPTFVASEPRPKEFQSTPPVWGATTKFYAKNAKIYRFQSTLPVWGATRRGNHQLYQHQISIHAPRVGSDSINIGHSARRLNFNPRSPCGERPSAWCYNVATRLNFNPRSPCGERPAKLLENL